MAKDSHLSNNFDVLRIIAALCVLYSHMYVIYNLPEPYFMMVDLGTLGVTAFFTISGYLIAQSWENNRSVPLNYLRARFLRVAPGYLGQCLVVFLLLFFVGGFTMITINGSLWTLGYEIIMYCLVPLFIRAPLLTLTALLCWMLAVNGFTLPPHNAHFGIIHCISFIVGTCFYKFRIKPTLTLVIFSFVSMLLFKDTLLLYSIMMPCAVLWLAFLRGIPSLPKYMGDPSYGLYIYGMPVQILGACLYPKSFVNYGIFSFLITTIFAYLSWRLIEQPMLKLKCPKKNASI